MKSSSLSYGSKVKYDTTMEALKYHHIVKQVSSGDYFVQRTCADSESFVRGGPTLTTFY